MSVGRQISSSNIDQTLTEVAVSMRDILQRAVNLSLQVNGQGNGLAYLESIGYTAEDAATAQSMIAYLNTVAVVYFGQATQASEFNFDQALSQLWAGE